MQAAARGDPIAAPATRSASCSGTSRRSSHAAAREPGDESSRTWRGWVRTTCRLARILGFAFTMVTGGNDTITGMLSGSACLLTEHPDQRAKLLADPRLIPNAVEELLRLTSPVQNLARTATRAVELHGVTIPAGKKVLLGYAAANRDEREFGSERGRLRRRAPITKILTLQLRHALLHRCRRGAPAGARRPRGAARPLPGFPASTVEAGVYARGAYVRRHLSLPWTVS